MEKEKANVNVSSVKVFEGSKGADFYGEGYYLRAEGSNYGRRDASGNVLFTPYDEESYLPRNRALAKGIFDLYKPKSVMVLGCARGYLVRAFRELGVDAVGVDISRWAVENSDPTIREHLYVGDICDLSLFEAGQFDVTVALDVFEHVRVPDLYTALDEAVRIAGGTVFIDVPIEKDDSKPDQSSGTDKSHVSVYSQDFWIRQFGDRGFRLDGKEVYTYPEGNQGATIIFRKQPRVICKLSRPLVVWKIKDEVPEDAEKMAQLKELLAKRPDKPLVDVVLINFNSLKFTPKCIDTLYKVTDYRVKDPGNPEAEEIPAFRLIVVDNQSTDGSELWLRDCLTPRAYHNSMVVYLKQLNKGFAEGVNVGLKHCTAPYVLLLNNDTLFLQREWLSRLVAALEADHLVAVASPKLLYPDGRIQYGGGGFNADLQPYHMGRFKKAPEFSVAREVPWATFACVLIRRELLQEGLDEAYRLGTFEDIDFCCRVRFGGWKVLYVPESVVFHYEGASVFGVNREHYGQQQAANAELFFGRWREWLRLNRNAFPEVYQA